MDSKSTKENEEYPEINMDEVYDRISELVCIHGPVLLSRGVKQEEAAVAILLAMEEMHNKVIQCSNQTK